MIQISTNYHKLVFVLQWCTTKTLQQRCRIQKFPWGRRNTPDPRLSERQSLVLFPENILKLHYCRNARFIKISWGITRAFWSFSLRGRGPQDNQCNPAVILAGTPYLIIVMHSLHLSTCALFKITENGQSILQKFILISTQCCQLQGTLSLWTPDKELCWGKRKMVKEFFRNSFL